MLDLTFLQEFGEVNVDNLVAQATRLHTGGEFESISKFLIGYRCLVTLRIVIRQSYFKVVRLTMRSVT